MALPLFERMHSDKADAAAGPGSSVYGAWLTLPRFALLLLVFVAAMFPDVLFGSRTFFYRDFSQFGYPLAQYFRDSFWRGEFPLWNPLNHAGVPFAAQWNTMTLYPPSLFYLLFPLDWSLGIFELAHLYAAGLGMYLLAHRWTANRFAAALAGVIYTFNGFAWFALVWPQMTAAFAWVPYVLLLTERAWQEGGRFLIFAALAGALQMLTGGVEIILFTWIIAGALLVSGLTRTRPWGRAGVMTGRFAIVVLLVSALAAAQLFPFFELTSLSSRRSDYADTRWPLPLTGWANFLLPLFGTFKSIRHDVYVQPEQQWTCSYYVGIVTVVLALLSMTSRRDLRVWLLWGVAILGILLAWGDNGFLYPWLRKAVPQLGMLRYPVKFALLAILALPLLAALGAARLLATENHQRQWQRPALISGLVTVILILLAWYGSTHPVEKGETTPLVADAIGRGAVLWLFALGTVFLLRARNARQQTAIALCLLGLHWIDNRTHVPRLNPTVARDAYQPGMVREFLELGEAATHGHSRMMPSYEAFLKLRSLSVDSPKDEVIGHRLALLGNLNLLDGISQMSGFFAVLPRETDELHDMLYRKEQPAMGPLMDFLGVTHLTASGTTMEWERRTTAMPIVTAGQKPVYADRGPTTQGMMAPDFAPREMVYIPSGEASVLGITNAGKARIVGHTFAAHRATIDVEAELPSLVVIAQTYYPCWQAYLNGNRTRLLRANHTFQAVLVPAGKHQITLVYEDRAFARGVTISLITLAGCVLGLIVPRVLRKRRTVQSGVLA